jgi:hypothetical protein
MTSPAPEHLPSDHRFREFQDNHYHDEDDHPGAVPPSDDATPAKKAGNPAPKKQAKWFPKQRRFEDD